MAEHDSLHNQLEASGIVAEQPLVDRKILTTSERGMRYVLNIGKDALPTVVYQVDGVIITVGNKCDKLVLVNRSENNWCEVLVELKGKNVSHAVEQLRSSLNADVLKHPTNKEIRARIVAVSFPSNKSDMTLERAKRDFIKQFRCELRGIKSNQPDMFLR